MVRRVVGEALDERSKKPEKETPDDDDKGEGNIFKQVFGA
jgi:hypothetical protein